MDLQVGRSDPTDRGTATVAAARRIADHGVIGNLSTMALVATDGTLDFMCWPNFDSPSVFADLIDPGSGGSFAITPELSDARTVQSYISESNVLVTRWLSEQASVELTDFMAGPVNLAEGASRLVRTVRATRGDVVIRVHCNPRPDYGRSTAKVEVSNTTATFRLGKTALRLTAGVALSSARDGVNAVFRLKSGQHMHFVMDDEGDPPLSDGAIDALLVETTQRWQAWSARSTYRGRWREAVSRSALVLKMMTSIEHGSIVAAATFGLPETPGGARNWDYRATWIRDASFTVYGLMRLGYHEEATAFTRWVADRAAKCPDGLLEVMYAVNGDPVPEEETLDRFAGYDGAKPVRIGNAAKTQLQLDIFGALLDSVYLSNKYGEAISHADWLGICRVVDHVCRNWRKPDAGIWESRSDVSEHLHSRLMCWVAVDRGLRLAQKRSLEAPFELWTKVRTEISGDIWRTFWNEDVGHFVRSRGSQELDGALLMMPLVRFVSSTDPAWLATLDAIGERLCDGGLVMRYDKEQNRSRREGSFSPCAFWYVECLARAGRIEQARANFERLLSYGNHVMLFSEEFDAKARLTGNFPQAFTHLALISAAFYLDRAIDGHKGAQWRV